MTRIYALRIVAHVIELQTLRYRLDLGLIREAMRVEIPARYTKIAIVATLSAGTGRGPDPTPGVFRRPRLVDLRPESFLRCALHCMPGTGGAMPGGGWPSAGIAGFAPTTGAGGIAPGAATGCCWVSRFNMCLTASIAS